MRTLSYPLVFGLIGLVSFSYALDDIYDQSGYQRPGQLLDPSEWQKPGRAYNENQMPGRPTDPTEYGLPGRKELPGENTQLRYEIDRQISLSIQDALKEGGSFSARFSQIYPIVSQGIVTLNGVVSREKDKQDAVLRVQRISGVRYVNDQIIIQP